MELLVYTAVTKSWTIVVEKVWGRPQAGTWVVISEAKEIDLNIGLDKIV